jgi:hypothetical protein
MLKGLFVSILFVGLLPISSIAINYAYYNKDISLFIVVDTLKDSLVTNIKIKNRTSDDIFVARGYFYVHNGAKYLTGSIVPASNIFDLGFEKQSEDYLHFHGSFVKISPNDSIIYTCKTGMPKSSIKTTINFDYLSTEKLPKKFIKNNILLLSDNLYQIDQTAYLKNCTGFRIEIE